MHRESPESAGHGEGCGPVTEAMRPGKQAACESRELKATNEDINYLAGPVIRRLKADFEAHSTEAGRNAFCQAVQRLFDEFLITCIRDANFPPASINLIADLTEILPDHPSLFFYLAVALSKSGRQEEARQARDDYMARFDTDADSLRDLALLCEYTNDLKEACMLCNKALAMAKLEKRAISDPEHSTEVKQKDDLIKNLSCLLLRLEAEQKRQNFLGTAIHRWKYLGNFEWYILAKVYELQRSDAALFAFYEISRISGMEERRLKWHWRKLIKSNRLAPSLYHGASGHWSGR